MSIYDVAKAAGVSKSTVSRVINNGEGVSEATAVVVRRAMQEMGFVPSPNRPGRRPKPTGSEILSTSRALPKMEHGCIAVVSAGRAAEMLDHPYYVRLISATRQHLKALNLSLVLDELTNDRPPLCVREKRVDGVLVTAQSPTPRFVEQLGGCHAVWVSGGGDNRLLMDHVLADNWAIGTMAAEYLLQQGCRRVAFVNCEPWGNSYRSREIAFGEVMRRVNVSVSSFVDPSPAPRADDWLPSVVAARLTPLIDEFLALPERPQGVFFAYVQHAEAAQRIFAERGVKIGGPGSDVIAITAGAEERYVSCLNSKFGVIDTNPHEMGRWAIERLLSRMANPDHPPVRMMVEPVLRFA
ncbi:MAG: LacI family DNA-binding transcriptional regulator [Planctomycetota bacterium]|nr:LacI family DNA-binding transcriptional regulator [Planctomycetota bacterium]